MKTLRIHFTFVLIPAIFCLLTIPSARADDPIYNGRALSEWLLLNLKSQDGAQDAIRQIGTNGIPTMINILSIKKSNKWWELMKLKSPALKEQFRYGDENLDDLRSLAVDGFAILGTNAESAVPQLARLFHNKNNDEYFFQTIRALSKVGPKGFAVLTNAMNDPDDSVRNNLIWVLGTEGGGDPKIVTQLLIKALKDPDPANRGNAAEFLAGKDSSAIPPLIELLDSNHTNYITVKGAAEGLAGYGAAAKDAAPILLSIYTNEVMVAGYLTEPDPLNPLEQDTQGAQTWGVTLMGALKAIDSDTAAKAEAFLVNSGPLNYARFGYTTTLLPNGKELIAGGVVHIEIPKTVNRDLVSAELLDPATGKWTETGEMNIARYGHSAILLGNGKVLVAGGSDDKGHGLTSAELYDSVTGKWTKTGSMNTAHVNDSLILQSDGKVRIKGDWNGRQFNGDELYDPTTATWGVIPKK